MTGFVVTHSKMLIWYITYYQFFWNIDTYSRILWLFEIEYFCNTATLSYYLWIFCNGFPNDVIIQLCVAQDTPE